MTATMTVPPIEQVAPNVVTRVREGDLKTGQLGLMGAGIAMIAGGYAWGAASDAGRFYFSYLVGYMGVLGICLCGLFFTMLQHVTRAGWSVGVRRLAENLAGTLPVMVILFLPIVFGFHHLYGHWAEAPAGDAVLAGKSGFLNPTFFYIRAALYFAVWIAMATFFRRLSLQQDQTGDPAISLTLSRAAAPGLLLFALSITFAAVDWIMTLDPHWFSTIFGVCYFAGGFMSFLAFAVLLSLWLGKKGYLREVVNVEHFHDIGKLMFGFMVFWTYTNFSQYMLIWYANLPEETMWYALRKEGGWSAVGTLLVVGHFLVPFAFLMSRHIKRNKTTLGIGAAYLLVIHWIDMQYLILPNAMHAHGAHGAEHATDHAQAITDGGGLFGHFGHNLGVWLHGMTGPDVLCYFGMLSLVAGITVMNVRRNNLVPLRDPRLPETLHFQNL